MRQVDELLTAIGDLKISPNEYITLVLHLEGKPVPDTINENLMFKMLRYNKFLDDQLRPTDKAVSILSYIGDGFALNVQKYRSMWPTMLLPSGKYARATTKEIEEKFRWFFNNFTYTWEEVFEATMNYTEHFMKTNYVYMKTSSYFIYKQESPKIKSSALAEWCDKTKSEMNDTNKDYEVDL